MSDSLRANLMTERRDWNRQGPPVPAWFRRRLNGIDPKLVMQFIPPGEEGVSPDVFPQGVWTVCRRLRQSRFLFKQWTWAMTRPYDARPGCAHVPTYSALRLIRKARDCWRNGDALKLQRAVDRAVVNFKGAQSTKARNRRADVLMAVLRACDMSKRRLGVRRHSLSMAVASGKPG